MQRLEYCSSDTPIPNVASMGQKVNTQQVASCAHPRARADDPLPSTRLKADTRGEHAHCLIAAGQKCKSARAEITIGVISKLSRHFEKMSFKYCRDVLNTIPGIH